MVGSIMAVGTLTRCALLHSECDLKRRTYESFSIHLNNGYCVRQWPGCPGFNPWSSYTKDSKRWYLIPPHLTLNIIRYGSRVKSSNPEKGVAPSPTPRVTLDLGWLTFRFINSNWHTIIWFQVFPSNFDNLNVGFKNIFAQHLHQDQDVTQG